MNRKQTINFLLGVIFFGTVGAMEHGGYAQPRRKSVCERITKFLFAPVMGGLTGMLLTTQNDPAMSAKNALVCSALSLAAIKFAQAEKIRKELNVLHAQGRLQGVQE